ncbi:MAG TPA: hypothetical protein PKC24_08595, partial [Cyclobacteriaceae bacterium]|nr:hypothetical protein [Cyclobacteriaceae bacterium]
MKPILAILLSILLFALVHFLLPLQVSKTASDIQLSIEGRINHVLSSLDEGISNATITWQNFDEALLDKGVNLIRIDRGVISDWKHEVFVPDVQMLGSTDKWTYFKNPSFHYLSKIYAKDDKEVYAIIVWLRKEYKVNNRYLNNHLNKELFKHPVQLSEPGSVYQTIYYNANPIFGIQISGSVLPLKVNLQGLIAFVFATIFFLISLCLFYTSDHLHNSFYKLLVPLIGLLVLRVVLLSFAFPAILLNHPVADPAYFASSWLSPSIIDLFISLLFLFFMLLLLFPQFKNAAFLKSLKSLPFVGQLGIKVVFYLVLFFAGLFVWVNFQTIYHNSSISFDITNSIQFDWLRVLAFASIILAVAVFFILSHIIIQLSRLLVKAALPDLLSILIASFIFVAFNLYHKQYILFPFLITLIYFSVVYGLSLNRHLNKITFNSFLYFFSIIIFASLIGAYAIAHFEREDETELQRRFANEFLLDRDELAEFLLNEARYKIAADLFIQTRIASPFLSKESIRQKIKQVHLSKYFDKYNADVYLFNANGVSFDQSAAESLDQLMNRTKPLSQTTLFDHIYFISEPDRDVFKRYIALIPVERSNVLVGYILINLTLKRVIPDNVYPELLVDTRFLQPYRDRNFSYALWADDKIIYTSGQFNYTTSNVSEIIGSELPSKMSIQLDEYLHAVVHDQEGRIAIVSSRWNPFAKGLANFSFMFLSYLGLLLLLIITLGIYSAVSGTKLNYAARIQLYLNMAFFLPLIIMSITVMSLMSGSFS